MLTHEVEILGTILFALAVLHTFVASPLMKLSHRFPKGSGREAFFHLIGEVEVVFGIWAALLLFILSVWMSPQYAVKYQESLNFTEPVFVFCIMMVAATHPILTFVRVLIESVSLALSRLSGLSRVHVDFFTVLTLGSLGGSFITEPAAMTLAALLLNSMVMKPKAKLVYFLLGTLFVNVSIGGTLTHFAAPPVLMVASKWNWDLAYVFTHFGWKSALAVIVNSLIFVLVCRKDIQENCRSLGDHQTEQTRIPAWVTAVHLGILVCLVVAAHHAVTLIGFFLFFLGITTVTKKYQTQLRYRESLLVAFFLAGIVMFGAFQRWWLEPLLSSFGDYAMFFSATGLTAITDNAALTYLGSQVEGLSESTKYFLVAGAVAGGGLTIIANAPNAAGYSVLQRHFPQGLNPAYLFLGALVPTLVAILALGLLPS